MAGPVVDIRRLAARISDGMRTARHVLELEGPFTPYDGPEEPGRLRMEVEWDVPVSSPALLEALNAAAQPGFEYGEEDMEGPHEFTIELELHEPGEKSVGAPRELEVEDYEVVAIDGMRTKSESDLSKMGFVQPSEADFERIVSQALESAKEDWAEAELDL